jgi:hypothetical protein
LAALLLAASGAASPLWAAQGPEVTDPAVAAHDPDFAVQGEYVGQGMLPDGSPSKIGAQVIALGDGQFQVWLLKGGLPGEGWDQGEKLAMHGQRQEQAVVLKHEKGSGKIVDGTLTVASTDGRAKAELKRVSRQSETLGAKPPAGAVVLFGGKDENRFTPDHGSIDEQISADGNLIAGVTSEPQFEGPYTLHLEFRLSWMPQARGQGRSNSGVYLHDAYEVQVLDSFGLEGVDNECAGIYKVKGPDVNMCLPPLVWQTYDAEFTPPKYDADGKKTANARVTLRHNGVVVHDDLELPEGTPGRQPEGPGARPLHLQGHGNHVQYRNVWIQQTK